MVTAQTASSSARSWQTAATAFDVEAIRKDFPILHRQVHGKPLVYLDNAATSQKPQVVIDAVSRLYAEEYASVHRGVHYLSERATAAYEGARETARRFINAADTREIIFVRGTTEGINLVASSFGKRFVHPGDQILITGMEHHSNIVPWQLLCEDRHAVLRVLPITDTGELAVNEYDHLLTPRTKLVAVAHVSNALGTINPVREIIQRAHARNIPVLLDGAQGVPHLAVDVQELDCDFYAFSGHKVYGPSGIGVLYGKRKWLEAMPPYQGGGSMISVVTFEKTLYNELPFKFEAGTPNVGGAVGLAAALDYVSAVGLDAIAAHEQELLTRVTEGLGAIPPVRIVGTARHKAAVVSFVLDGIHPHDIGTILDREGIAIRAGHHCAQPVMQHFEIPATARASFGIYNTASEVGALVAGVAKVVEVFA